MKKLCKLLFILLIFLYVAGVFAGAVWEMHAPDQNGLYRYLSEGIKGYETQTASGIKAAATENLKFLLILAAGGVIKPFLWLPCAAMLIKGYLTGFSVMAALRLYGMKGCLLCIANFLSAAVIIPVAAYYGSMNITKMILGEEKYYKNFLIATIFLIAIFCADALIKGALSPIFVKWASGVILTR